MLIQINDGDWELSILSDNAQEMPCSIGD